jgi:hypothetical protein
MKSDSSMRTKRFHVFSLVHIFFQSHCLYLLHEEFHESSVKNRPNLGEYTEVRSQIRKNSKLSVLCTCRSQRYLAFCKTLDISQWFSEERKDISISSWERMFCTQTTLFAKMAAITFFSLGGVIPSHHSSTGVGFECCIKCNISIYLYFANFLLEFSRLFSCLTEKLVHEIV